MDPSTLLTGAVLLNAVGLPLVTAGLVWGRRECPDVPMTRPRRGLKVAR